MEFIFDLIAEVLGEALLQLAIQFLAEPVFHMFAGPFSRNSRPWVAALGHAAWGLFAGGLSLIVFPNSFLHAGALRIANLVLTPVVAGLCMRQLGLWRERNGEDIVPMDRFFYAFLFALGMATVRFVWAK